MTDLASTLPDTDAPQEAASPRQPTLSCAKGRSIRTQLFLTDQLNRLLKVTVAGVMVIQRQEVAQSLVMRLAIVRLTREVDRALNDPVLAAELRDDLAAARRTK